MPIPVARKLRCQLGSHSVFWQGNRLLGLAQRKRYGLNMRLFLLTAITMIAFASNSILTRMAIGPGFIDPISFTFIRVLSGAVFLSVLILRNSTSLPLRGNTRIVGATGLSMYMIGFSMAYVTLDAGLGALILFGVVQISMFSYGAVVGAQPTLRQLVGACIAFAGLMIALWPDGEQVSTLAGALFMVVSGFGWAAYTLSGKNARDPLAETAANFVICVPVLLIMSFLFAENISTLGILLAILCGAITSGLGYALWYRVLPDLQQSTAAVVQLSVPIIAILAGALLLGENLNISVIAAVTLVVFGIGLAVTKQSSRAGRS